MLWFYNIDPIYFNDVPKRREQFRAISDKNNNDQVVL